MKRLITILTAAFLLTTLAVSAQQNNATIRGAIMGEGYQPLAYATVSLMNLKDSSLVRSITSDSTGNYSFQHLKAGTYIISVSMTGYKKQNSQPLSITEAANIEAHSLQLSLDRKSMVAVTVTAKKPLIERKIDRTIVNVEGSSIAAGSTAMEVLERAPGIIVDKDGNISMGGKSGVLVMIDGKQTYMSNSELAQFLKSMQSSQVEAIELITNPSAKYDAAGNSGIINIKTKKSKTVGTNGTLNAGAGYGNQMKTNVGLSLNHRNEHLNAFGNYSYDRNHTGRVLDISRVSKLNNQNTYFTQQQTEDGIHGNNNFKAGVDVFINSKNTLGFLVNGYSNNANIRYSNFTKIGSTEKAVDSMLNVPGENKGRYNNMAYNINYRGILDSTGKELTVDVDYSHNTSNNYFAYENYFFNSEGATAKAPYLNRNNTPSTINIKSIKADYVYPVSKTLKLEAGIKSSMVRTDNDLQYEELDNDTWKNNLGRSNHFIYDETIHAAYLNANRQFKNTSIQFGVRAEKTLSTGNSITESKIVKRSYFDLFPSLFVNHSMNEKNSASFSYSRRIDRPSYDALNPFVYYLDQYTFQKGNPFLNPQYTHSFEAGYMFQKKYTATFNYSLTKDIITDVILPDTIRKGLYQTAANVKSANFYSLTVSGPVKVKKWWSANNTLTVFNNQYHTPGLEGLILDVNKTSFYFSSNNSFTLPKGFTAEASANYRSSMVYGTLFMKNNYGIDLGMGKAFLNKKANVRLSVSDVLNTRNVRINSTLSNVNYNLAQKHETRIFRLTFAYRFGSNSIKDASHRSTGLESEQSRIKR